MLFRSQFAGIHLVELGAGQGLVGIGFTVEGFLHGDRRQCRIDRAVEEKLHGIMGLVMGLISDRFGGQELNRKGIAVDDLYIDLF